MKPATIHINGQVAELMEDKGVVNAKIVCNMDHLMVTLKNTDNLELGGDVEIEGEIRIKSIKFKELGVNE